MIQELTRDEMTKFAVGELFFKRDAEKLTITREDALLYAEAFISAADRLRSTSSEPTWAKLISSEKSADAERLGP